MNHIPAFGICGYSGSGKTTLIEALLPRLRGQGLKVAVVKQDAHGLQLDHKGKDTDRLFQAGADVFIRDDQQYFARLHRLEEYTLERLLDSLARHYDLTLVEGHKSTLLPYKIWLAKPDDDAPPPEATGIQRILGWNEDRLQQTLDMLAAWLLEIWGSVPVYAGILMGGGSTRMGRPKHLIKDSGQTWLEKVAAVLSPQVAKVVLLGRGEVPESLRGLDLLPDAEDAGGPLRGMRAAMRWAPHIDWLFTACDQPYLTPAAVAWLLDQRQPGTWAVQPQLPGAKAPEPLLAYYDFRAAPLLEQVRRPCDLSGFSKVKISHIPSALAPAWSNINTREELCVHKNAQNTPPQ